MTTVLRIGDTAVSVHEWLAIVVLVLLGGKAAVQVLRAVHVALVTLFGGGS